MLVQLWLTKHCITRRQFTRRRNLHTSSHLKKVLSIVCEGDAGETRVWALWGVEEENAAWGAQKK
jgi:hypothetical protein